IGIKSQGYREPGQMFCWTITVFKHRIHTKGFTRDIHTCIHSCIQREEEHRTPADSVVVALPAADQAPSAEET
ncbi:hypothetical protein Tco_0426472, partial [Tanacetum coccineum]